MKVRITIEIERDGLTFADVRAAARAGVVAAESNDTIPHCRTMHIDAIRECTVAIEVVTP